MHTPMQTFEGRKLPAAPTAVRSSRNRAHLQVRAAIAPPPTNPDPAVPSRTAKPNPHGRVYNFAAGPACLPVEVLETAQNDLLNWQGCGISVMELSHRSKEFTGLINKAEADLRKLLDIPDNYKVMFLQGGASGQFAAVPLNLTKPGDVVDQIVTGAWSKKAAQEAGKYANVNIVAKGDNNSIPEPSTWKLSKDATYVSYCDNETIQGVEFKGVPEVNGVTLVADMSSNFLSKPVDVAKYGLIYAGVQKNVGPAGVVVAIVREDLIGNAREETPAILDYKVMEGSLYNTPPCWTIYMCGLVFDHMLRNGGLASMHTQNQSKAQLLYDAIDNSGGFYNQPVDPSCRSLMNVPFTISKGADLEGQFLSEATKKGLVQLKGHRSVGGMRASIYNSMPVSGVQTLVDFMKEFAEKNA